MHGQINIEKSSDIYKNSSDVALGPNTWSIAFSSIHQQGYVIGCINRSIIIYR